MNKKQKKMLIRILISAALLIALSFAPVTGIARFVLYFAPNDHQNQEPLCTGNTERPIIKRQAPGEIPAAFLWYANFRKRVHAPPHSH